MADPVFRKGHVFAGPNGSGYRLKRDAYSGQFVEYEMLEAFGGAEEPQVGKQMPIWLWRQIAPNETRSPDHGV